MFAQSCLKLAYFGQYHNFTKRVKLHPNNTQTALIELLQVVLPSRFELLFAASETTALSIELREQIKMSRFVTSWLGST